MRDIPDAPYIREAELYGYPCGDNDNDKKGDDEDEY